MVAANSSSLQYAASRATRRLLTQEEAAAPIFWLTLLVIVQDHSPIGPIQRFLLRAVELGIDAPDALAGFLGLDRAVVDRTVVDLWQLDLVDLVPSTSEGRRVVLTSRGKEAAARASTLRTAQTELEVAFDRLTWAVSTDLRQQLLRPRDVRETARRELDPRKGAQPLTHELPVESVRNALEVRGVLSADQENRTRELVGIRAIKKAERMFRPVDLIAFGPADSAGEAIETSEIEIALGMEGHLLREHSMGFATTPQYAKLARQVADAPSAVLLDIPPALGDAESPAEEVAELQVLLAHAESRLQTEERANFDEPAQIRTSTDDLRRQISDLSDRLAAIHLRQLQTWELADVLREARYGARKRLLIISPWITGEVVNADFIQSLGRLTSAGVSVHIGYGFPGDDFKNDPRVLRELSRLVDRSGGRLMVRKLGTTHEKVLIFDDTMVTGSFNWLSFKGDANRAFRRESGTLIKNAEFVEEQYRLYAAVIEEQGAT